MAGAGACAANSSLPLTEACMFWCGGLWRRRLALRWAELRAGARWRLEEGGG